MVDELLLYEDGTPFLYEGDTPITPPIEPPSTTPQLLLLEDGDALLLEDGGALITGADPIEPPSTTPQWLLLEDGELLLLEDGGALITGADPIGTIGPIEGVEVHVELGYYPEGSPLIAYWDTAVWDGVGMVWMGPPPLDDVSCNVEQVTVTTGRDQPLERFRASTCSVTLNDPDGRYTPWATATNPYTSIRPGNDLRVWIKTEAGTYRRFTGKVNAITDHWPDPSPDLDARHQVVFQAHDLLGEVAAFDGVEMPPVGAGELTGTRIARILDNARVTDPARDLDPGTVTVQATTLAKNAVDEIGLTTDTERGAFFAAGDGTLRFLDRNGLHGDPKYTTVQAVFGEQPGNGELCYTNIELASDDTEVRNLVGISRTGGTIAEAADLTSQALYGVRTYRRTDLAHETDTESAVIAQDHLDVFAYAANRVENLTASPSLHPDDVDALLALGPLQLIEVRRRTRGFQVVATLQIQSVREQITATSWTIDYDTFTTSGVFDVGRWDTDLWDTGEWGY